ncbi:hypothetical protein [Niallia sp. 03133]|uniref:hypothetical protein n=1 Tax=Niallia sp. 03133 TaxID=3458060 RepID=UPI0040439960
MVFLYGFLLLIMIEELTVLIVDHVVNGPFKWETTIKKWVDIHANKIRTMAHEK